MNDTTQSLLRKMASAGDLHGIVRSMKALAISNIGQYEHAVQALTAYAHIIELGLGASFRQLEPINPAFERRIKTTRNGFTAVVFGSDHGLVGPFNDIAVDYARKKISSIPGNPRILAIGERAGNRLTDAGLTVSEIYPVPLSVSAITTLIGQILFDSEAVRQTDVSYEMHVFYNQPESVTEYKPVGQQVLPFDQSLRKQWMNIDWPTRMPPDMMGGAVTTTSALIREFLFVSLFKACALSLASENASRLAAMQRADKNIEELLKHLSSVYNHLRQQEIDDDLSDIISGYEAQAHKM
jgi:F-type H+-transporting ATPase subunit gamma